MGLFSFLTNNKQLPSQREFTPYGGLRPPRIDTPEYASFRPVQKMITDTLMRRSQGQDVGYDPARRTELQDIYDIDWKRQNEQRNLDYGNLLSGVGQSRNLAARDALIGRAQNWANDTRSKYLQGIDVEDLTQRNLEKREATQGLQNLNTFNFGQENNAADFDLNVYNAEEAARGNVFNQNLARARQYENPYGAALRTSADIYGMTQGRSPSAIRSAPSATIPQGQSIMSGGMQDEMAQHLGKKAKMSPTGNYGSYRLLNE